MGGFVLMLSSCPLAGQGTDTYSGGEFQFSNVSGTAALLRLNGSGIALQPEEEPGGRRTRTGCSYGVHHEAAVATKLQVGLGTCGQNVHSVFA